MKQRILILDDEISICTALSFALEDRYQVEISTTPAQAFELLEQNSFDFCLLDLRIGKHNGVELIPEFKARRPDMTVIVMTAYGSIESSVQAVRNGAYTYLSKPLDPNELYLVLDQAEEYRRLNDRVKYLTSQLAENYYYHGMVGSSNAMRRVYDMVERLRNVETSVLITGESGTGKELVAKALHFAGNRAKEHLATVNCAAIPEGLLESELFGHKKGAFTGAVSDQVGKLVYADQGTLFLDEIGDMPLALQAKLLRVLQDKECSPIGSNEKYKLNIRVIAATNRSLADMVAAGEFRQDLYFRLNVVEIEVPPLRERREDIPLLIEYFLKQKNKSFGKSITGLSNGAANCLYAYSYPGNVRELINILEHAMVMCDNSVIEECHLPKAVQNPESSPVKAPRLSLDDLSGLTLEEVEKRVIKAALEQYNGHRIRTAQALGISEKGLRNKIAKYHL